MSEIPDGTVDMILTDPPYGTTACKWDAVIPLEPMWGQLKRIIKPNGAIVMTASQPFTSVLVSSNLSGFKYCWVWYKNQPSGFASASRQPMKVHEDICVFYRKQPIYNKQITFSRITDRKLGKANKRGQGKKNGAYGDLDNNLFRDAVLKDKVNPRTVVEFDVAPRSKGTVHPTQKPVALMEYLIKTYTNEGETVLDFTMGSGTTGVACKNLNRRFIGIEKDAEYFEIARKRINDAALARG